MAAVLDPDVLQDEVAVSLAHIIAAANKRAREASVNVAESLMTITQISNGDLYWRINYGPKDYINRRGGDVIIEVNATNASIRNVQRGQ
ncbi:MAG TPA: hypothetical protein VFZ34_20300 [Blastocatellia bacterium]|nr:hypothetical protein [Blastocatellia bacterium]